jgi:opine dehydrogenase
VIVAVLGAGNGSLATAADLALRGHEIRLWARNAEALEAVRRAGGIAFTGEGTKALATPAKVTEDLGAACAGAAVVVAPVPATAHEDLARRLAPVLTPRQIVLLAPGTLGTYVMAREVARAGGTLPFALVETGTLPYLARRTAAAEVTAPVTAANLPTGIFPASRSAEALATARKLYGSVRPCVDALDAALTNAGPVLHPPLFLLNTAAIDGGRLDIHGVGTTPSVRRLIEAVDAERLAARTGWGYPAPHYEQATYYEPARAAEGLYGLGARDRLEASGLWNEGLTFAHRYVSEDVVLGLALLESAARTVGADTHASTGLLHVFGALLGRPLARGGRALEALGFADLAVREIQAFLHEGWASPVWDRLLR